MINVMLTVTGTQYSIGKHIYSNSIVITCKQFSTPTAHDTTVPWTPKKHPCRCTYVYYYYIQQRRLLILEQKLLSGFYRVKK